MTKQFQIYWTNLDPAIGAEIQKTRPCLVVSPDEMNGYLKTTTIVPLTSTYRNLPTRVLIRASEQSGLKNDSYAVLDQIKTVDKSRLTNLIGEISEAEKRAISDTLKMMFDY